MVSRPICQERDGFDGAEGPRALDALTGVVSAIFPSCACPAVEVVDAAIAYLTAFRRDELVAAAHTARDHIRTTVYDSQRKRGKPE